MEYQFPSGWLKFDIAAEGSGDVLPLTWISLGPTEAPTPMGFLPFLGLIPVVVIVLALVGAVIYRRRVKQRETLQTPPDVQHRRGEWSIALDDAGARMPWLYRLIGIREIDLTAATQSGRVPAKTVDVDRQRIDAVSTARTSSTAKLKAGSANPVSGSPENGPSGFRTAIRPSSTGGWNPKGGDADALPAGTATAPARTRRRVPAVRLDDLSRRVDRPARVSTVQPGIPGRSAS